MTSDEWQASCSFLVGAWFYPGLAGIGLEGDAFVGYREMTEITMQEGDHTLWEKGRYVTGDPGVSGATQGKEHGDFVFDVGSGQYSFKLVGQ